MSNKTFSPGTVIDSPWLNDVNDTVYDILGDGVDPPATEAAARTNLGLGNVDNTTDANKPVSTATQTALNLKANLASPAFTGNPTAPTPAVGDNDTSIATTAFVKTALQTPTLAVKGPATAQAMGVGVANTIVFPTVQLDSGSAWVPNRWAPQVAGWYFVTMQTSITVGTSTSDTFVAIYKNNAEVLRGDRQVATLVSSIFGLSCTGLVQMNGTTDYIEFRAYSSGGGAIDAGLSSAAGFLAYPT